MSKLHIGLLFAGGTPFFRCHELMVKILYLEIPMFSGFGHIMKFAEVV